MSLAKQRWQRFLSQRRGVVALALFVGLLLFSACAELFISERALLVRYQGRYYFPTYGAMLPGSTFGLDYEHQTNYRELRSTLQGADFVLLPLVPYSPYESDLVEGVYPPSPADFGRRHFLGTDSVGRDLLARLVYGFRIAITFSLLLLLAEYLVASVLGCLLGYFGGRLDLLFQRLLEVWANLPFLYVIIIVSSVLEPSFGLLLGIMLALSWTQLTWSMRTITYHERTKDYVLAARGLGASPLRIILRHLLPNSLSVLVTFAPFSVASGIAALSALDFLGFGLPAPTPSWGELLKQGATQLHAPWILGSVLAAMLLVLILVTLIGDALREAFDAK